MSESLRKECEKRGLDYHWVSDSLTRIDKAERGTKLYDYLEQPDVLMSIPQPHRLAISELLHGSQDVKRVQAVRQVKQCGNCCHSAEAADPFVYCRIQSNALMHTQESCMKWSQSQP